MFEEELKVARELALGAGEILLEIYKTDFAVEFKGEENPVTKADQLANAFLVEGLSKAFPDDMIVAEESVTDDVNVPEKGRCWFVDPLDGTKEFIKKNGEFAVMIGLAVDGDAKVGVVFQAAKDKLYTGVVGQGAHMEHAGKHTSLSVSDKGDAKDLTLVVSRSHRAESIDSLVNTLGIQNELRSGSVGLKVGMIGERRADLYVHLSDRSYFWDSCGPEAVLRAAGGRFTKADGSPYRYVGSDLRTVGGILASNLNAYSAVQPSVEEVARSVGFI